MQLSRKKSFEYNLLLSILFSKKKIDKETLNKISFKKLIKVSSKELLIPCMYYNLKIKENLKFFPSDFCIYIKKLYEINKSKNLALIDEANKISSIFKKNNINFSFFKGVKLLQLNIFNDIGERMVGDIDIIIDPKDFNRAIKVLKLNGFSNKFDYLFTKKNHPPRYSNKKYLHAVEPHIKVLNSTKKLLGENVIDQLQKNNINILRKICLFNCQVNDYGYLYGHVNLRASYDFYMLSSINREKHYLISNKYEKSFFYINMNHNVELINNNKDDIFFKFYKLRLRMKSKYKFYYQIDNFLCKTIIYLRRRAFQSIEFLFNSRYRKFILKKYDILR